LRVEAFRKPLDDLLWQQDTRSRGGEFERERQVIERPAELPDVVVRLRSGA
jgi:hypothetical protein